MSNIEPSSSRRRPDGPPAGVLGVIVLALTIAAVVAYGLGSAFWMGVFTFGASVPLGIYTATTYARLLRLGIRVPGPSIGAFGGASASVLLGISGLLGWAQTRVADVGAPVSRLVAELVFALGGVGFAVGLGLLIAGIAVPSVILRLVPGWLGWVGLVLAFLGEISFLAMLWDVLDVLLPIVRFAGLAWIAVVGFLLPGDRRTVSRRRQQATGVGGGPDEHFAATAKPVATTSIDVEQLRPISNTDVHRSPTQQRGV